MREIGCSILYAAAVAVIALFLSTGVGQAGVVAGPTLSFADSGWQDSGLGFTATVNSTLTSFTFQNQGYADQVDLVDAAGNILNFVTIPALHDSYIVSVNWSLTGGHQYYLLQTTFNNGYWVSWGQAAPSDAEIALTDTGDFSSNGLASAHFNWGGGSANSGTAMWADFNNITTNGTAPEPASLTLVLPFAVAVLLRARRKGFVRNE
jgi:hypothetical protein